MKRLDVTIQSFLWGEKAIGKEGEIVAAIQAQRQHLHESPTRYTVSHSFIYFCFVCMSTVFFLYTDDSLHNNNALIIILIDTYVFYLCSWRMCGRLP